jgi:hypothetical protein
MCSETIDANVTPDNVKVRVMDRTLLIHGIAAENIDFVDVYDIDGLRLCHEVNLFDPSVNVSHLKSGIYVVVVRGNGVTTHHKIAIN